MSSFAISVLIALVERKWSPSCAMRCDVDPSTTSGFRDGFCSSTLAAMFTKPRSRVVDVRSAEEEVWLVRSLLRIFVGSGED